MRRSFLKVFATLFGLSLTASAAEPANPLVGVWEVREISRWNLDTNIIERPYGERPTGKLAYSKSGHMVIFLANEDRPKQSGSLMTDADRIAYYKTQIAAYAGTYHVDGDKVVHRVTSALNPSMNATDQVRIFKIEGEKLIVMTAPTKNSTTGAQVMGFLTYARLE